MRLRALLGTMDVIEISGELEQDMTAVTDDSRVVQKGNLFVAIRGERSDGHSFIGTAIDRGAAGIVLEQPLSTYLDRISGGKNVSWVRVKNSRVALGKLAGRFYHEPAKSLRMIGVTGTNGKTTVTHLVQALVEAHGGRCGVIGTVGYLLGEERYAASHTTPGPVVLQDMLAKMVAARFDAAVLEVSSHALAMDRVEGCEFDVVVFTNLTQDHLDFHGTMEQYFEAKRRLFTDYVQRGMKTAPKHAIVNIDDPWGRRLVADCAIPVWTYAIHESADIRATDVKLSLNGTQFAATTPMGSVNISSSLVGEHNVYNLLAAIGAGLAHGFMLEHIQQGLQNAKAAPGRFERIEEGQSFAVIVDYAHTEDALARLLSAAQKLRTGRIITVFGCGGDRDPGKRPKMGQVAAELSDCVYVTSDNPRSEDPARIIQDIECGIHAVPSHKRATCEIIPDRATAIRAALQGARPGDMVLIAGKGHEDYQIIGSRRLHFDDREEARKVLRQLVR